MNLYQSTELAKLESHIDFETGEINLEAFEDSKIALVEKQRAVVACLKNNDANINMLDNAIKELTARKKSMQARHDSLKDYLLVNMLNNGISEINADNMTFSAKIATNPPSVVIDDESLIPAEYMRVPPVPPLAADKTAIKDAIKAGIEVPGVHLESTQRVNIK